MRLKKIDLAIIAVTLSFVCFLGGYFTGRRAAVNIITVPPPQTQVQMPGGAAPPMPAMDESLVAVEPVVSGADIEAVRDSTPESPSNIADSDQIANPGVFENETQSELIGAPRDADGRININTASRGELMDLSGIGEVLAGRIIEYRERNGGFSRIEDLRNVSGIGEKRFEAIKDDIRV